MSVTVQAVLAGSQVASWTHAGICLRPSDISCQYSRSIYTRRFNLWQPCRSADTSTNWRQSLFCCCTASMEQVADGAETAAIDGLVSSWSESISVWFCLQAPGYGLTLWCTLGLQYKFLSYSYSYSLLVS